MHGRIKLWQGLLTWTNVFFGNLAGALCCVAFMAHYSGLYSGPLLEYAQKMAVTKTSEGFGPCLLRGIGCNFLVCIAVWLGASSREIASKILGIHFPVFVFVFLGFEHVVV
jgi:formate/nitrite transporter FocA (FNT family)